MMLYVALSVQMDYQLNIDGVVMINKIILISIILVVLVLGGLWLSKQLKIDSCLDAGGRWNYENGMCDTH